VIKRGRNFPVDSWKEKEPHPPIEKIGTSRPNNDLWSNKFWTRTGYKWHSYHVSDGSFWGLGRQYLGLELWASQVLYHLNHASSSQITWNRNEVDIKHISNYIFLSKYLKVWVLKWKQSQQPATRHFPCGPTNHILHLSHLRKVLLLSSALCFIGISLMLLSWFGGATVVLGFKLDIFVSF
jgi:hypothetical protein